MRQILATLLFIPAIAVAGEIFEAPHISTTTSVDGYGLTRWGMSPSNVKKAYPKIIPCGKTLALSEQSIAGMSAFISFSFTQNKLASVVVLFTEHFVNTNNYAYEFEKIKGWLTKKYGTPSKDRKDWSDDLYKDEPDNIGMAISTGRLKMFSEWEMPSTRISSLCTGENFEVSVVVYYKSKNLAGLEDQEQENEALKGF